MKSDLSLMIDDIKLNIRVGIIFKFDNKVLLEIPKILGNSVIPGGRVKIDELSINAIKREIKEEMNFNLLDERIIFKKNLEYFFTMDNVRYHEFFFVYEYTLLEDDYKKLINIRENLDNHLTHYEFVSYDKFDEVNLLPLEIRDIIKE